MKLTNTLPDPPLTFQDLPQVLPEIGQAEIVAFSNASLRFYVARADLEQKRAALSLKLLQGCKCVEGSYFVSLDENLNLVVEDHASLEVGTRRPITDRNVVPSGGAA